MAPLLLFPGLPGGVELLVVLVLLSGLFVVPLVLVVGAYLVGKRRGRAEATGDVDSETTDQ